MYAQWKSASNDQQHYEHENGMRTIQQFSDVPKGLCQQLVLGVVVDLLDNHRLQHLESRGLQQCACHKDTALLHLTSAASVCELDGDGGGEAEGDDLRLDRHLPLAHTNVLFSTISAVDDFHFNLQDASAITSKAKEGERGYLCRAILISLVVDLNLKRLDEISTRSCMLNPTMHNERPRAEPKGSAYLEVSCSSAPTRITRPGSWASVVEPVSTRSLA